MNTLIDTPERASHANGMIEVIMSSGEAILFATSEYPRLSSASDADLNVIEVSPFGLHWPKLDEDLSIRGLLQDCLS